MTYERKHVLIRVSHALALVIYKASLLFIVDPCSGSLYHTCI